MQTLVAPIPPKRSANKPAMATALAIALLMPAAIADAQENDLKFGQVLSAEQLNWLIGGEGFRTLSTCPRRSAASSRVDGAGDRRTTLGCRLGRPPALATH